MERQDIIHIQDLLIMMDNLLCSEDYPSQRRYYDLGKINEKLSQIIRPYLQEIIDET